MAGGYQMARMTQEQRAERDRLMLQILDAVRALHERRMVRYSDVMLAQDEGGPRGANSTKIGDALFYAAHPNNDYRLEVTLVVRAVDR